MGKWGSGEGTNNELFFTHWNWSSGFCTMALNLICFFFRRVHKIEIGAFVIQINFVSALSSLSRDKSCTWFVQMRTFWTHRSTLKCKSRLCDFRFWLTICVPQQSTKDAVSKLHMLINLISSCVINEIDLELALLTALIWWRSLIGWSAFSRQLSVNCCM